MYLRNMQGPRSNFLFTSTIHKVERHVTEPIFMDEKKATILPITYPRTSVRACVRAHEKHKKAEKANKKKEKERKR